MTDNYYIIQNYDSNWPLIIFLAVVVFFIFRFAYNRLKNFKAE